MVGSRSTWSLASCRTGRAGNKGICVTFITPEQDRYSIDIYRALKASDANMPKDLEDLANGEFVDTAVRLSTECSTAVIQGSLRKSSPDRRRQRAQRSGFGGDGLDRLDQERDAKEKAECKAYGEPEEEKTTEEAAAATKAAPVDDMTFGFKVEVKRGPAPDSSKGQLGVAGAAAAARGLAQAKEEEKLQYSLRAAEEAAARAGKDTAAHKQALSVVAKLNAQLRAHKLVAQSQLGHEDLGKKSNIDATEFHAIIPTYQRLPAEGGMACHEQGDHGAGALQVPLAVALYADLAIAHR